MPTDDGVARAEALKQQVREQLRSLNSGDQWRGWLDAAVAFPKQEFENLVLIATQRPDATRIASAGEWHELGRHIDVDEKAIQLLSNTQASSSEQHDDRSALKVIEYWDVSQTFGQPLPVTLDGRRAGPVPDGLWSRLSSIAQGLGFHAARERLSPPDLASVIDYDESVVIVSEDFNDAEAVSMLAHEVAHLVMHSSYLEGAANKIESQELLEIEAMSVEYLIVKPHGILREPAFDLIPDWIRSIDPRDVEQKVQQLAQRVFAVAKPIMEATSTPMLAVGNLLTPARTRHLIVAPSSPSDTEPPIDRGP
ncbi:hypothetical protein [Kribbella deserti]|uniref:ImmA/IrrE family metallo-endopeptidase n=1 Tax=Kribbella deserti TaxID=1926257 RepID=A0ABV6QS53_9ACTN